MVDDPHASPTAAGGRFHQYRQLGGGDGVGVEFLEHRDPGRGHHLLGLDLGAHCPHRVHRWPDPHQPGGLHRGGEIGVLREESVARVYRVGTGRAGRRDDRLGIQIVADARESNPGVRLGDVWGVGVGVGVDRDSAQAEIAAGREHPPGDLAAVGHQNSSDFHARHIRKTPKFDVPLIGPLAMADRHIPKTVRVSRGSITPSS